MEIPSNLKQEIELYCKVNNIDDIDGFIIKVLKRGFSLEKFGASPVFDNIRKIRVDIVPKTSVENINVDVEIRPANKKDLYGE